MDQSRLPILLLISGPPACGKTTLAGHLADRMGFILIGLDRVKTSIATTHAGRTDDGGPLIDSALSAVGAEYGQRAFAAAYAAAQVLLERGVSVVVEKAWHRGLSEPQLRPLINQSRAINLHLTAPPDLAMARLAARGERPGLASNAEVAHAIEQRWDDFAPMTLDIPALQVDTANGYNPALDEIEAWIWTATAP